VQSQGEKKGKEKKNTPLEERVELPSLCRSTAKLILVRHSARVAQRERERERERQRIRASHLHKWDLYTRSLFGASCVNDFAATQQQQQSKVVVVVVVVVLFFSLSFFWVSSMRSLQNPTKHCALHN
jgi:hypothetical protein